MYVRLLALGAMLFAAIAMPAVAAARPVAPTVLTLRPQGTAVINVIAFCLDRDLQFPQGQIRPAGLADPRVRATLAYAVSNDLDQTQFYQVQQAIWFFTTGQWFDTNRTLAEQIVNAVNANQVQVPDSQQGVSISDALANGQADVYVDGLNALNQTNYFGTGTLRIANQTNANLTIRVPFGTVFPAPGPQYQGVVVYATEVQSADEADPAGAGQAGGPSPILLALLLSSVGLTMLGAGFALRGRNSA